MIVLNLKGGFGNQIFQFIASLNYSSRYNSKLHIYTGNLKNYDTKRNFDLENILPFFDSEVSLIKPTYFFLHKYFLAFLLKIRLFIIQEKNYSNRYFFFNILDSYFLEKKFLDNYHTERFKKALVEVCERSIDSIINEIDFEHSIGIHIRAGDRQSELDLIDFRQILNKISAIDRESKIFCFTDDVKYSKEKLFCFNKRLVFINEFGLSTVQEFFLISKFKYFIAPNSTFSLLARYFSNADNYTFLIESMFDNRDKELKDLFSQNPNVEFV